MTKLKIVAVKHLTYDLKAYGNKYYFKTNDKVTEGDIVYCDTSNGLALCKVVAIYKTIDELQLIQKLPNLQDIKECTKHLKEVKTKWLN